MRIVPLQAVASQTVSSPLGGQNVKINIYQRAYGLFMDVYADNVLVIQGVLVLNKNLIVRDAYLGFVGDFIMVDTQGSNDPDYTGLGDRYQLVYLEASDLGA